MKKTQRSLLPDICRHLSPCLLNLGVLCFQTFLLRRQLLHQQAPVSLQGFPLQVELLRLQQHG
jgi:hypothetical protein